MHCNIFTYGSLMFPAVWKQVVQGRYPSRKAMLNEHARYAIAEASYPGMVARRGATVEGLVYLGVDAEDVARLDAFEGVEYRRSIVHVTLSDGGEAKAQTYLYLFPHRLRDAAWQADSFDLQQFLRTYCTAP